MKRKRCSRFSEYLIHLAKDEEEKIRFNIVTWIVCYFPDHALKLNISLPEGAVRYEGFPGVMENKGTCQFCYWKHGNISKLFQVKSRIKVLLYLN